MIKEIDIGIFQVAINIDGEWWIDDMVPKWFTQLKLNSKSAYNSRKLYARALDIFFHYYIFFPQRKKQSLHEYLLEYREKLQSGFNVYSSRVISTNRYSFTAQYKVFSTIPYSINTVNSYMTATQWYLSFLKEQNIPEIDSMFSNDIDWGSLKRKSINSAGGGYGLMMGPLLTQLLGPKKKLIHNIRVDRRSSEIDNYFPPELFLDLLKICNPRERAIYLLCGCAGTRIGQALSLTRDDYNYDTQEVFIVDPLSDEKGPSGIIARSLLLKNTYNINMEKTPFKYLACKYPIPLQYTELLWINNLFVKNFFHELSSINKGNPIQNGHPFVFNTSTGKILTPNEVYRTFRRKIEKLYTIIEQEWKKKRKNSDYTEKKQLDEEYKYLLSQLKKVNGPHSLRHMYAIMWADLAATSNEINIDDLQSFCAYGLGHTNVSSVMQYFNLRKRTRQKMIAKFYHIEEDPITYIQKNLTYLKNSGGGRRYEK
ncbi:MAG: integrase [Sulfurimonas sp.]|jgi:integrase